MKTERIVRRVALVAGGGAVVAMAMLNAGCGTSSKEEPSTTPSSTTSQSTSPAVSPTEKVITPGGDQSFSPTIKPHNPGSSCEKIVGGTCVR